MNGNILLLMRQRQRIMRQSFIFSTYFKRVITRVQHEVDELLKATQTETQEDLVRRMKAIIPEFLVLET